MAMTGFVLRFIFIVYLGLSSITQASDMSHIILADGPIQIELKDSMQWAKADHTTFSLAQLLLNQDSVFVGLSDKAVVEVDEIYWLRFKVINPTHLNIPLALSLSTSSVHIDAAYRQENEQWQRIRGIEHQKQLSSSGALILNIEGMSNQWLYFRIKPIQTNQLEPKLQDLNQYSQDSSILQQVLGAIIALMIFVGILHLIIIRFHNHTRHYLIICLAFAAACFSLSHSQIFNWSNWFLSYAKLTPWVMASILLLSSYHTDQYRVFLKSNLTIAIILSLVLFSLILAHAPYIAVLVFALVPSVMVMMKSKKIGINLIIANTILLISTLCQLIYIISPDLIFAPMGISYVYALTICVLFASLSMVTPYFQKQVKRNQTQGQNISGMFLENLSHELRTPMNGVLGMSELLSETPLSAKQRDYIDTITYSGQDMLRMVNRISDYAKIQSGRIQLNHSPFEVSTFAKKCLSKFQFIANQKGIELVLNIDDQLPAHIITDENRIETILDNLLDNAVRHTEYGEVELKISQLDNHKLLFAVRDTGCGIEKLKLKQLLGEQSTDDTIQLSNHGFGLSLCKKLIQIMSGNLYAQSRIDNGSTFSFTIALQEDHSDSVENVQNDKVLQGLSILIVDDNSTLRKVMQRYANSWGMQSQSTFNGKEALALLRSQSNLGTPYDIILIDQDMPIMDGFQLAKRIQEDKDINQNVIKIMLTGMPISNTQKEVIQFGIDQVITKPVSAQDLKQVFAKHITNRFTRNKST
ncbi:hypothetical protein NBRC116188_07860 [Oceaniserpentilla sp. 4NH20-0058]|uniref:ATP-binding protein n=1 Tax=Oceaniserpentilla sp. 4NH20-0058 TaxID=3127660 RepID=UPI00310A5E8D